MPSKVVSFEAVGGVGLPPIDKAPSIVGNVGAPFQNNWSTKNPQKTVTSASLSDTIVTSVDVREKRFIPHVDFATASNFVKFGSAKKYYQDSYTRIHNYYPYDGSLKERNQWEASSSYLDNHIFEYVYPRTNGHIKLGITGSYTDASGLGGAFGFLDSTDREYIYIKGGPNADPLGNYKISKDTGLNTSANSKANYYDATSKRVSNLQFNLDQGVTVEFWLKKEGFPTASIGGGFPTYPTETFFHLVNDGASVGTTRGDFRIFINSSTSHSNIYTTITSGAVSHTHGFDTGLTSIADSKWHHYAFVCSNSPTVDKTLVSLYVDGVCISSVTGSGTGTVNEIHGSLIAALGANVSYSYYNGLGSAGGAGWGKVASASYDEFRYWKTARTAKQIGRFYIDQVPAGTNTDNTNVDLGVYYKFNEGITNVQATDSTVLDYSGRINNGAWVGYSSGLRLTTSAMVESGKATHEFKDPIIYDFHPTVKSTLLELQRKGEFYDDNNTAALANNLPTWIREDDTSAGFGNLDNVVQILSTYLDTLYLQIEALPTLKNISYIQPQQKPYFFNQQLLSNVGFNVEEILTDNSLFSYTFNRDDYVLFREKLYDVKNQIYKNIYNNLVHINKAKGTEKSFRNLMRCLGIDEEIIRMNVYASGHGQTLNTSFRKVNSKHKYVDFYNNITASVYSHQESSNPNSAGYIAGSGGSNPFTTLAPFTMECEVVFPKYSSEDLYEKTFSRKYSYSSSSLFGCHSSLNDQTDTTWKSPDQAGFQVHLVRLDTTDNNPDTYFALNTPVGEITSSTFQDVYQNTKWNFAAKIYPSKYPLASFVSGTLDSSVNATIEFEGYNLIEDQIINSFNVTRNVTLPYAAFTDSKRLYIGAHRTNFTGSLLTPSDAYVSHLRFWLDKLESKTVRVHAVDDQNYGTAHPNQNSYLFQTGTLSSVHVPQMSTLALNWDFNNITASNTSGRFNVSDFSYGNSRNPYGDISEILNIQHTARGDFFKTSNSDVVERKNIYAFKQNLPEIINSDDQINLVSFEDEIFTRESRPITYYYTFEKSMYRTISEEMINLFASMKDFHNLIGDPVNRYRLDYKDMSKIKSLFFERVSNTPDLDKYLEYYKWIDSSITKMLYHLVPATADFAPQSLDIIESHVLERNKYQSKFPTIESKNRYIDYDTRQWWERGSIEKPTSYVHQGLPVSGIASLNPSPYAGMRSWHTEWISGKPWRTTPVSSGAPQSSQFTDPVVWSALEDRGNSVLSSGDPAVDHNRNIIREVVTGYGVVRGLSNKPVFKVDAKMTYGQTQNSRMNPQFTKDFFVKSNQVQSITVDGNTVAQSVLMNLNTDQKDIVEKRRLITKAVVVSDGETQVYTDKSVLPFSIFSSSISSSNQLPAFHAGAYIGNLGSPLNGRPKDFYAPLQGPWGARHVGGMPHNFQPLITHPLYQLQPAVIRSRAEPYNMQITGSTIVLTNRNLSQVDSKILRDPARSPAVFKNIKTDTMTGIGNYTHDYEILQTNGTNVQKTWFRDNYEKLSRSTAFVIGVTGNIDFNTYSTRTSSLGKSVFNDRFSALGSPQVNTLAYLDPATHTFSVYNHMNYRNSTVRLMNNTTQFTASDSFEHNQFRTITNTRPLNSLWRAHMGFNGYDGVVTNVASTHKIPGNRKLRLSYDSTGAVVTQSVYDNGWIQHAIPQSLRQYQWISSSLEAGNTPFGYVSGAIFQSASQAIYDGNRVDFAGMNTLILDPILGNNNIVSSSTADYRNTAIATIPSMASGGLNALLLHRNGPYGLPSWKQIRHSEKAVVRHGVRNNIFSGLTRTSYQNYAQPVDNTGRKYKNDFEVKNIYDPIVVDSNNSLKVSLNLNQAGRSNQKIILNVPYCNNMQSFANEEILYSIQFGDENLQDLAMASSDYATLLGLYNQPGILFNSIEFSQKVWPRNENSFLSGTRARTKYFELIDNTSSIGLGQRDFKTIWKDQENDRYRATVPSLSGSVDAYNIFDQQLANGYTTTWELWRNGALSVNPLDGRTTADSDNKTKAKNIGLRGQLHKGPIHGHTFFSESVGDCGIPIINIMHAGARYHGTDDWAALASTNGSCEVNWTTNVDRGTNPWFNSYEDYSFDLSKIGKNSSVIPEFNISRVIPYYYVDNRGDFGVDLPKNFLQIDGTSLTSSQSENDYNQAFFKEYSFSDFMNHFDVVLNDHKSFSDISEISLTCEGYKKLIPYNGFYPVNRTMQLASLLSQSYGEHITGASIQPADTCTGTVRQPWRDFGSGQPTLQSFIQPFFAPGILYNTIKSGIACDWPAYTGSAPTIKQGSGTTSIGFLSSSNNYRLQFETLYDLSLLPTGSQIYTVGNGLVQDYFQYNGSKKHNLYQLAINNYLAESVNFFLKDSKLTSFVSKPMSEVSFETGKTYRMKIELEMKSGSIMTEGARLNVINVSNTDVSGSRGRPYGPAVRFSTASLSGDFEYFNTVDPAYAPYTPPYFYGKSILTLDYTNSVEDTPAPTLDSIFNALTQSFGNTLDTNIPNFSAGGVPYSSKINANTPAMQNIMSLTASIDLFGKRLMQKSRYDADGRLISLENSEYDPAQFEQWVISTKYECPVLEFNEYTDIYNSRGMWNGYGQIPNESQGLELRILGPSDREKAEDNVGDLKSILFGRENALSSNNNKKVGRLADDYEHSISEALVAIPFLDSVPDKKIKKYLINSPLRDGRKFFKIYKRGDKNGSVLDLKEKLGKYVFPPKFDFVNMSEGIVDPFVMFVFEFEHKLKKQELQDIWQGVLPQCGRQVTKQKSTLSIPTETNELLANFLRHCASNISDNDIITNTFDNFKWLIFKVKKRAKNNYSGITEDMTDDQRLIKGTERGHDIPYSYNWPYDYCSLVELANITTDITLTNSALNEEMEKSVDTQNRTNSEAETPQTRNMQNQNNSNVQRISSRMSRQNKNGGRY